MKTSPALVITIIAGMTLCATANAFVVEDTGITPGEMVNISVSGFYTGEAMAGVNNLVVNGVQTDGFCIDPYHFSVSSSPGYSYRSLSEAPKLPGTMGALKAEEIMKLWAMVYSPFMTAQQAAGLQIALWEIVGGDNFQVSGNDFGATQMLQDLGQYSGPRARLVALSGPGQDYVIPPVPEDGSTLMFVALAAVVLVTMNRWRAPQLVAASAHSSC